MSDMTDIIKRFKGSPAELTSRQVEYIRNHFEKKGPVLIRLGKGKLTKFLSPDEHKKLKEV
ncbi:hypothetical protein ACOBQJ_03045 [Pelotomaculum propionicicum]